MPGSMRAEFISAGCNRCTKVAAWNFNGTLAYGASNSVALFDPLNEERKNVHTTLRGHSGQVNCVEFVNRGITLLNLGITSTVGIISGSSDGNVILWGQNEEGLWNERTKLTANGIVNCIATMNTHEPFLIDGKDFVVAGTSTGQLLFWLVDCSSLSERPVEPTQTIVLKNKMAMSMGLTVIPGTNVPLLACGVTDHKVDLYTFKDGNVMNLVNFKFSYAFSLTGHENWVRDLSFGIFEERLLLASASQDKYIRLWDIHDASCYQIEGVEALIARNDRITIGSKLIEVKLESLLIGHEDWVYSAKWAPIIIVNGKITQPLRLLTASADKTMMMWEYDEINAIWINKVHIGEIGGSSQGLYGALFSPDGESIISHGYSGGFNLWMKQEETYVAKCSVTGHLNIVESISWSPNQKFLLSVSKDQTARIFSQWKRDGIETWHEIARPQIHGYDLQCATFIDSYKFISGADEKVLRIFEAPKMFAHSAGLLGQEEESALKQIEDKLSIMGANVPALGLSNKAVYEEDTKEGKVSSFTDNRFIAHAKYLTGQNPPLEHELINATLWPEMNKLYGHVYELFAVACSHDMKVIASTAKATSEKHASIKLWNADTWSHITLPSHSLTVTRLSFSNDDNYLLSVSRDRHWTLFKRKSEFEYELFTKGSGHARIIWGCSWTFDDNFFATCSRDKKVNFWKIGETAECVHTMNCEQSITAIDFYCKLEDGKYLFAIGFESGDISLYHFSPNDSTVFIEKVDSRLCHSLTVNDLKWNKNRKILASCGQDHSVRIFSFEK